MRARVCPAPVLPLGAEAEGVSPAGQADLAEHARQGQRHPVRLLAMVGPLGGQREVDERALGGHLVRQRGRCHRRSMPVTSAAHCADLGVS